VWFALSLSALIVTYNNVINRWHPFHGPAYVPVNLAFAGTMTLLAAAALELNRGDLGLRGDVAYAAVALGVVALFGLAVSALARSRHGHRIADRRVQGLRGRALAFYVLVRIPVGTAVTEEVLFRGVLFAAWRNAGASPLAAALYASVAFGLWHVSPTIIGLRMNDPDASPRKVNVAVAGAVVATTVAGLGLTWLRLERAGLLAPILFHAGVNSVGAIAAVTAGRRQTGPAA